MKTSQKQQERQESINLLRDTIDPKEGVVIVTKNVSKTGMSRKMAVYTRDLNSYLSYHVAKALDWRFDLKTSSVIVGGCGMDMAFHLAYSLTFALYSEEERKKLTGNGGGCLPWKTL